MNAEHDLNGRPSKRRKLETDITTDATPPPSTAEEDIAGEGTSASLQRPISPPVARRRKRLPWSLTPQIPYAETKAHVTEQTNGQTPQTRTAEEEIDHEETKFYPSPFQLTKIRDLAPWQNIDTVAPKDILGDPLIKECWNFNYLFDLDFVMDQFDTDVKKTVNVKIVHGFWKNEDEKRIALLEQAKRYPNIQLISAYMPDPFGTHHSKMLILLRHDDSAQVVIHTANMIQRDWTNMTQAVWRSPLVPLQSITSVSLADEVTLPIGSGGRFKKDLLCYLNAYGKRLNGLTEQLTKYDFRAIQAAFIASAPSRQTPNAARPSVQTSFGWLGLKEILSTIPVRKTATPLPPSIVVQISSIATLGASPAWLNHFHSVLNRTASANHSSPASSFFTKASFNSKKKPEPELNIIFPTAPEIRTSLDGYTSGASIHTKIQSPAQQKQLEYLRPLFCHWKYQDLLPDSASTYTIHARERREAHRGPAAPHIKTYVRFADVEKQTIDWAMVTSANLSKQAWGEVENKKEEVWIQSHETGVVVWPALFSVDEDAVMVPVFGRDMLQAGDVSGLVEGDERENGGRKGKGKTVIGFRMPYDLPMSPYKAGEVPWCATMPDSEEDWMGRVWKGY
ncbi:uncharacterized protein N0V89_000979 [Didymosphaeria variabile]|uniref:Phospholipase D/nuclease n=1 Tax=Didymosphaeria variabile TaxID=1932322 RepID=A0A9W8XXT4_9PLEO|nr:uncharacterized protein N0V89_000979 [Didymosphaeria variabile]KAJ4360417.1 hypothetical protein N0V89_000979 [Didymosphaeria variabile]